MGLISHDQGLKILDYLGDPDNPVWVSAKFQLDKTVDNGKDTEMELWISSGDDRTYEFVRDF